jgi:hypothetical protein
VTWEADAACVWQCTRHWRTASVSGASVRTFAGGAGTFGVVRFADWAPAGTAALTSRPAIQRARNVVVMIVLLEKNGCVYESCDGQKRNDLDEEGAEQRHAIELK